MWSCPHCSELLQVNDAGIAWACINGHQFDRAKEGYVNLLPTNAKHSREPGDSGDMIAARRRIHERGLYQGLAAVIEDMLSPLAAVTQMLDLGCGEGYYGQALQAAHPQAQLQGVDISKAAVKTAAKRYIHGLFAVASTFHLPLPALSQNIVLRVFAPADDGELLRVLAHDGAYLEVGPAAGHMQELREQLYDHPRPHVEPRSEIAGLKLEAERELSYAVELGQEALADLVAMTPFAHRGHREKRERLLERQELSLQMNFALKLFRKGPSPWSVRD